MTGSVTPLADLPLDTGSDAWIDGLTAPGLPDDLAVTLQNPRGANLDPDTINLLSDYGVYDALSFIQFTQEPFSDLLGTFSDEHFGSLSRDRLCNAQLYGCYLMEQKLIKDDGTIDDHSFDWHSYYTYWTCNHQQVSISFNAAYHLKAEAQWNEALLTRLYHEDLTSYTGPGMGPTITPIHNPPSRSLGMPPQPDDHDHDDSSRHSHAFSASTPLAPSLD